MRYFFFFILVLLSLIILGINISLHKRFGTKAAEQEDIICQLNFLEEELKHRQLGERMQQIFPEGFVFINALYGLAWCELALAGPVDVALKKRALQESLFAYNELNTESTRLVFTDDLAPPYGIFYNGWRNYLLSKILVVDTTFENCAQYVAHFKLHSEAISSALRQSVRPYLESYTFQAWPADMFVAMASLSHHDHLFDPKYAPQIEAWLLDVRSAVDPGTKLIPHEVDSKTGMAIQGARGSSIGLILRMLGEIDHSFALEQYGLAKDNFITTTLGLPSVREFPKGQKGQCDIDSGPVMLGIGFSATIMMIGTMAICADQDNAQRQYNTINAFGFPWKAREQKKYILGKLPIADAFIAWGRATMLNNVNRNSTTTDGSWAIGFHSLSALMLFIFWVFLYRTNVVRNSK